MKKNKKFTNTDLNLPDSPTLQDFHEYIRKMEIARDFNNTSVLQNSLQLGEEVGELFKAIRKVEGYKTDKKNSKIGTVKEELADVFMFLLAMANRYNIDLEQAFRDKEEVNKKRVWS
jgi:NTP pyrophosphatase (non-canonical NTP hydrolase)